MKLGYNLSSSDNFFTGNHKLLNYREKNNNTYKSSAVKGQNEVKKRLQSSLFCGGTWLNLNRITAF